MPKFLKTPCSACGSDTLAILIELEFAQIECSNCGHKGPKKEKLTEAVEAWNQEK